ncbi:MAG: PAS domain-containing protein [Anaerolineae bacterium]|nr:PAS domain-containing protein [Anaerolineae bacterium]
MLVPAHERTKAILMRNRLISQPALQVATIYLVVSLLWILFSDRLLEQVVTDADAFAQLQTVKGMSFVLFTALVIFGLVNHALTRQASLQARYRHLFEANPHPMWIFEVGNLRFLEVNDAAVQKYGYSRAEFLRMTLRDIRPEEEIPRLEALQASLTDQASGLRLYRASAGEHWTHRKKMAPAFRWRL